MKKIVLTIAVAAVSLGVAGLSTTASAGTANVPTTSVEAAVQNVGKRIVRRHRSHRLRFTAGRYCPNKVVKWVINPITKKPMKIVTCSPLVVSPR